MRGSQASSSSSLSFLILRSASCSHVTLPLCSSPPQPDSPHAGSLRHPPRQRRPASLSPSRSSGGGGARSRVRFAAPALSAYSPGNGSGGQPVPPLPIPATTAAQEATRRRRPRSIRQSSRTLDTTAPRGSWRQWADLACAAVRQRGRRLGARQRGGGSTWRLAAVELTRGRRAGGRASGGWRGAAARQKCLVGRCRTRWRAEQNS
ncbi:hypothetical protein PVAP13_9KG115585 [Panicum virgatum]|uniref:Uncharacterized protein n=1 Tax=Panicum virgatum TaxID=38727 RepID=A0A8T0NEC7_PANVG|nr:hypothetical protein PVAP13_9KG115585 [Panicum virgatum]